MHTDPSVVMDFLTLLVKLETLLRNDFPGITPKIVMVANPKYFAYFGWWSCTPLRLVTPVPLIPAGVEPTNSLWRGSLNY